MVKVVTRKRRSLLSVAMALGASLMVLGGTRADSDKSYSELAGQFCDYGMTMGQSGNPDYCGFVDDYSSEYNATIEGTGCYDGGTAVGGWPSDPPAVLWPGGGTGKGYDQTWYRYLSLYCTGDVKVEAVFQPIPSEYQDVYGLGGAGLEGDHVTRCSLGTGESPVPVDEATDCVSCKDDDCPQLNVGEWYVDSAVLSLGGNCPPSDQGYPMQVGVYTDAGMKLNLTSFTATEAEGKSGPSHPFHPCFVHSGCDADIEWIDDGAHGSGWYCSDGVASSSSDTCDINLDCVTGAGAYVCGDGEDDEHTGNENAPLRTHQD
jgi:hypothetical protein